MTTREQKRIAEAEWKRPCANCNHPHGFHGHRDGYPDKCVGVYQQPPCQCLGYVPSPAPSSVTQAE